MSEVEEKQRVDSFWEEQIEKWKLNAKWPRGKIVNLATNLSN